MITSRILPRAEWPRLRETGAEMILAQAAAKDGAVLVEECGDQIVGCAVVFTAVHIDAVWVHPAFRTGRVALRLWRGIRQAVAACGVTAAWVHPSTTRMQMFCAAAVHQPNDHYVMEMPHAANQL